MKIPSKHCGYSKDGIRFLCIPALFDSGKPDNSGINRAAEANANLSKETLDWYKQMYAEQAPTRQAAADRANLVSDAQLVTMKNSNDIATELNDYNKSTFRPLEKGIVDSAQTYDTPERKAAAAATAMAGVQSATDNASAQLDRNLSRRGVAPGSGAAILAKQATSTGMAGQLAAAGTKASNDIETQGYARKMDAANLGRNIASNQATSAGIALNAGNSSVNNASVPLTQANQATQIMGQGFTSAGNLNQSSGSLYGQASQIDAQTRGQDMALMGSAMNAWAMKPSDKNLKKNIKKVSDTQALKQIEKTPVATWDYKPGEGDGGHHIGPMAQTVQKNMGNKAGPGGKMIDLITLNGKNMAAIAALSRKVDKLAKQGAKA